MISQAIDDRELSTWCAKMCRATAYSKYGRRKWISEEFGGVPTDFKHVLIGMVQSEWEKRKLKERTRSLGIIRFIGELFNLEMLSVRIMRKCVNQLLGPKIGLSSEEWENSLECLCEFLTTIGKILDSETSRLFSPTRSNQLRCIVDYIHDIFLISIEMQRICNANETSTRIKSRIQQLIDLGRRASRLGPGRK